MRTNWTIAVLTLSALGAGCSEPEPAPVRQFESLRMTWGAGPCPPNADCDGRLELQADGSLRLDTPCNGHLDCDRLPPGVYEANISAEDLDAVVAVLTAPDLLALLDGVRPVCEPPSDIYEDFVVVLGGVEHGNETTTCAAAPLQRARDALSALVSGYLDPGAPVLLGGGWSFGFCAGQCIGDLTLNGTAARYTITGHRDEDPVFVDNRGMLTLLGMQAVFTAMVELRDVTLDDRYGCPDCADGGASHVTIERAGEASTHTYEYGRPPAILSDVDALLDELMDALETCTSTDHIVVDSNCVPRPE